MGWKKIFINHVFDKRLLFKYVKNSNAEIILKK